jgi:hypothetical protein
MYLARRVSVIRFLAIFWRCSIFVLFVYVFYLQITALRHLQIWLWIFRCFILLFGFCLHWFCVVILCFLFYDSSFSLFLMLCHDNLLLKKKNTHRLYFKMQATRLCMQVIHTTIIQLNAVSRSNKNIRITHCPNRSNI